MIVRGSLRPHRKTARRQVCRWPFRRPTTRARPRPGLQLDADVVVTIRSDIRYLSLVRAVTGEIARKLCLDPMCEYEVKLAVGEACANAIEHGSPRGSLDQVTVKFSSSARQLRIEVADSGPGCWPTLQDRSSGQALRGYGIRVMRAVMDRVDFVCDRHGTRVLLIRRLPRLMGRRRNGACEARSENRSAAGTTRGRGKTSRVAEMADARCH